jgi:hypothetical protein
LDEVMAGPVHADGDHATIEVRAGDTVFQVVVRRRPMGVHGHSLCSGEAHPHRFDVLDLRTAVSA